MPSHRDGQTEAVFRHGRIRLCEAFRRSGVRLMQKPVGCRLKRKKMTWQKPEMSLCKYRQSLRVFPWYS